MTLPVSMMPMAMTANRSTTYSTPRSLRFRVQGSSCLRRTIRQTGDLQKMTFSFWFKPCATQGGNWILGSYLNPTNSFSIIQSSVNISGVTADYDSIGINFQSSNANTTAFNLINAGIFRDFASWYHVVVAIDTTQATAANRIRIYSNNVELSYTISTTIAQNSYIDTCNTIGNPMSIGGQYNPSTGTIYYNRDMLMSDFYFIDGQQLTPSSFGYYDTTTGVWRPNNYNGTYGANGFYLPFDDIAQTVNSNDGLGRDTSGNDNYFITSGLGLSTATGSSTYSSTTDVPHFRDAISANYPVVNRLINQPTTGPTFSVIDNNLSLTLSAAGSATLIEIPATMAIPSTGIYYWEVYISQSNVTYAYPVAIGISSNSGLGNGTTFANNHYYYIPKTGNKVINGTATAYGATAAQNDYIGVLFDAGVGKLTFYKNGVGLGDITGISTTTTWYPKFGSNDNCSLAVNFGQLPFYGVAGNGVMPGGVRLNAYNTPDSAVLNGAAHMAVTKYSSTGTGTSVTVSNSVMGVAFTPDLVIIHNANTSAFTGFSGWQAVDNVRGSAYSLDLADAAAEVFLTPKRVYLGGGNIGFTVTSTAGNGDAFNSSNFVNDYVAYQWKTNSGAASTNIATNAYGSPTPSIASSVSVNSTAKFSIVTYTGNGTAGATVGHGFAGTAPSMIFIKQRTTGTSNWVVYHTSIGNTTSILLNSRNAAATASNAYWNNTTPGVNVFTLGTGATAGATVNTSGYSYVAYCWAEVTGYSAFGSYTGNNNADGPFVYLGFRPRFIMIKDRTTALTNWLFVDTTTSQIINPASNTISLNAFPSYYGQAVNCIDIYSNGFKIKIDVTTAGTNDVNKLNDVYIYAAFAENPFKNDIAR